MVSQVKNKQVENIQNLLKDTSHFVLIKYDRTTHRQLENLRKQLKTTDSHFKVVNFAKKHFLSSKIRLY